MIRCRPGCNRTHQEIVPPAGPDATFFFDQVPLKRPWKRWPARREVVEIAHVAGVEMLHVVIARVRLAEETVGIPFNDRNLGLDAGGQADSNGGSGSGALCVRIPMRFLGIGLPHGFWPERPLACSINGTYSGTQAADRVRIHPFLARYSPLA